MSAWIETFSGRKFHLLDPQPDEISIVDIAHALSMQCRFTGHTKKFFSVAEHSVHVSLLSSHHALAGLLHDASEAYLSDLSRPVKQLTPVGIPYYEVEDRMMRVIAAKFGFEWPLPKEVKVADNIMLMTEKDQLMTSLSWDDDASSADARNGILEYAETPLIGYLPKVAERIFLERFEEISPRRLHCEAIEGIGD
jgi:5'-deoxynucleotidase YfbR-like HD superfamily hydrolase